MERPIRDNITRHDSVTDVHEEDLFEDARSRCSEVDQLEAFEDKTLSASTRVFQTGELLERILLHVVTKSDRANAQALLRASRISKTWRETIIRSLELQRRMWFCPRPQLFSNDDDCDYKTKTVVFFNPILWPTQPKHCTINVTNNQLSTGSRGPGSWRRMLLASASRAKFHVLVEVEGFPVAIVECNADMTMGMLLDQARRNAATSSDLERPVKKYVCKEYICIREELPEWEMCEKCLALEV
ncbi:hypothetical protein CBER1_07987 [Cercospora berteroae]|uniref:F-box domain-containing protein n=1 Tax=Cercospora berteroae TaxID=357750 RepID=A0A2S6CL25_9PEZI|nr:hypothetical protein CBER1_07987 [Cercospora berteroae]